MTGPDDLLVLGGGPASCAAAMLLRRIGYPVVLVTRPPDGARPDLSVSLTPSCRKVFEVVGLHEAIETANLPRSAGNTVWWGRDTPRVEPFGGGEQGWQVSLRQLETTLHPVLRAAGVRIEHRALTPEDALSRPARFRLDGTGRTGILARRLAGRRMASPHRTIALSAAWDADAPWPVPDATHTLVEGYPDGWAWSVPVSGHRRVVAVMVDPQASRLARGDGAHEVYRQELSKTRALRQLVAGARMVAGPTGWDATEYCATSYAGKDWLVMGDAATFVDPLSSAGVKKALTSGWLAAVAVHTSLRDAGRASLAQDFFAAREQEMFDQLQRLTRRFLSEGHPDGGGAFWRDRGDVAAVPADDRAGIEAAWERIRAAARLRLVPGSGLWCERPAVRGMEIVPEWRLVTPQQPAGIRFIQDVDIKGLVEIAPRCDDVPGLYAAYCRRHGPAGWPAVLTALSTAVAHGWLQWADDPVVNTHDTATR